MKRKKKGVGGADWMATYGDFVTLLLCFFVMLYSMSSVDSQRWIALVQSFNPDAVETQQGVPPQGESEGAAPSGTTNVEQEMEAIYQELVTYMAEEEMQDQMTVTSGSGYVFITFDDTVFFNPDSPVLLDSGKTVLDQVGQSIQAHGASVGELRVLGHTAQGDPTHPNDPVVDRTLSSSRANNVTLYLQEKQVVEPSKLVSIGYGQWRPISSNGTQEGRAKNRRVELIVTGMDMESMTGDSTEQYYTMRDSGDPSAS